MGLGGAVTFWHEGKPLEAEAVARPERSRQGGVSKGRHLRQGKPRARLTRIALPANNVGPDISR